MTASKYILQAIHKKTIEGHYLTHEEIIEIIEATSKLARDTSSYLEIKSIYLQITKNKNTFINLLTKREVQILKLIGSLKNSETISKKLYIKLSTVETHRKNIRRKLKIKGTNELYHYAMLANLIKTAEST